MTEESCQLLDKNGLALLSSAYASNDLVHRGGGNNYGYIGRNFDGFTTNRSVRSDYSREDYNAFRPSESFSKDYDEVFRVCNKAYEETGIVKNIIDLMGDFTCTGIKLCHPDPKIQKFYREWFNYVDGENISERFCNYLYRLSNVPIYTGYGKLPVTIERKWTEAYAIEFKEPKAESRRIPVKYTFLNPRTIEVIAPELAPFQDRPMFALKLGNILKTSILGNSKYRGISVSNLMEMIPEAIRNAAKNGQSHIPFTEEELRIYYYKKDDWEVWARPMIYSIMKDIIALEKLKLADISALDGAISSVRLWNIGQLTDNPLTCVIPSPGMINKLRSILAANVGGGTMDLVWGPELKFTESQTTVHNFLGMEKYESTYHNIYQGLGVPTTMSGGSSGGSGGYSNSMVSMQTLIERLKYGRSVLRNFWTEECKKIQLAMRYKTPAKVQFGKIMLGDETAAMKLLIELWDRNIITDDVVQESFDYFPEVLRPKLKKEYDNRVKGKMPPKGGPYFNPNVDDEMRKIILQKGGVAPSEVGLELLPKKEGEKNALEQQAELMPKVTPYAPSKVNGRPKNAKDSEKRKQRKALPSAKASFVNLFLWANDAQKKISETVTGTWVKDICNKKDVRSLTEQETENLEYFKFKALSNLTPYIELNKEIIAQSISNADKAPTDIDMAAKALVLKFKAVNNREPTTEEKRQIQSSSFALFHEIDEEEKITDIVEI